MWIVPKTGKFNEHSMGSIGELNSHVFLDIEILFTPNHGHRRFEPVQIRLKIVLVPGEV
jgi:hypothetical protein